MAAFPISVIMPLRLATIMQAVVGGAPATAEVFRKLIFFIVLFSYSYRCSAPRVAHCTVGVARRLVDLIPGQFADGLGDVIRPRGGDRVSGHSECGSCLRPTADWLQTTHVVLNLVRAAVSTPLAPSAGKLKSFLVRRQPTFILLRGGR